MLQLFGLARFPHATDTHFAQKRYRSHALRLSDRQIAGIVNW